MKLEILELKIKQIAFEPQAGGKMWCVTENGDLWKIENGIWIKSKNPEIKIKSD